MFGGLRRLHKYRRFPFLPFLLYGYPNCVGANVIINKIIGWTFAHPHLVDINNVNKNAFVLLVGSG
jgi:hypothetical protein